MTGRRLRGTRRTNLALAVLVPAALATGGFAFAIGSGWAVWAVVAHGVVGFGVVVVSPWKSVISRRGVRRRGAGRAWASILLGATIVVVVSTGLLHATGLGRDLGPVTAMQVHVGSALVSVPLFVWHLVARPVVPRRTDLSRRALLRSGAVLGTAAVAYATAAATTELLSLPGAERRATGSYEQGSFAPEAMPVTQWLDDRPPVVDANAWRLDVVAAHTRSWTLDEVGRFSDRVRATLDCTGGWYATQDWEGVRVSRLLPQVGDARSVVVRSVTGYERRFPVGDIDALLLAVRAGGRPISVGYGAPARLVAPGRRGFWWVKWVTSIRVSHAPWWWQPPFPLT